ncbi:rhamnose utilization protein RhaD (predicted bifunctional aldolase and dehydrogenase) [Rhizobium aquaticum]|uniref:Rhamnose utilization protein RhaD (Predicted bifunctional aldolase and dehydrogenase) n=1 Tax=Rhizobium aquaticum TaxID=1549636 RepID=A0ABV2J519_9HYPH
MAGPTTRPVDFDNFIDLSRRIGTDVLKTQGAGGNTSIKADGVMWVKASGTWLSEAGTKEIMVPVEVTPLVEALRAGDPRAEKSTDFVVEALNLSGLRPSIETSFHAALPQRVIAHYHCVNTIAHAVASDRSERLKACMAALPDLTWATVPYRRPGVPLAREIDKVASGRHDILFLFNHGVIVCGDSVEEVADRIERVTAALEIAPRHVGVPDMPELEALSAGSGFRPAVDLESHRTALDVVSARIATGGSLYPDHVIFLGTQNGVLAPGETVAEHLRAAAGDAEPIKMLIVPGKGVLLSDTLTPGGEVMARCLAEVVTRIADETVPAYIGAEAEAELTNWEAERYRQALDRKALGL